MKIFTAQYDDDRRGHHGPVVLLRTDSLEDAIAAVNACRRGSAYVRHEKSGLQRYVIDNRVVWLDDHGREHRPPPGAADAGR